MTDEQKVREAAVAWADSPEAVGADVREVAIKAWQAAVAWMGGKGEDVAWCCPDDPINSTAFAWPGTERDPSRHTTPLYTHPPRADADAKDAARYRWLRDKSASQGEHPIVVSQERNEFGMGYIGPVFGSNLDKTIDQALAAERGDQ